jgi:hypothetical protein
MRSRRSAGRTAYHLWPLWCATGTTALLADLFEDSENVRLRMLNASSTVVNRFFSATPLIAAVIADTVIAGREAGVVAVCDVALAPFERFQLSLHY